MVFFSGMPSEAAGPVAETVTPTVMSARALPETMASTAAIRAWMGERRVELVKGTSSLDSVGECGRGVVRILAPRDARLAHGLQAAEEQVGDDRRHLLVREAAVRAQPGEH